MNHSFIYQYSLAVGFKSGALRVFDIEATTTIIERKIQKAPVAALLYVRSASFPVIRRASSYMSTRAVEALQGDELSGGMSEMFSTSSPSPAPYSSNNNNSGSGSGTGSGRGSVSGSGSGGHLLLFTAGLDGDIIVYDAENEYVPLKTLSAVPSPSESVRMAVSADHR